MDKKLLYLFELGGKKNYEFHFKMNEDGENILTVDKDKKIIDVTIGDPNSKELPEMVDNIILDILK